MKLVILEHHYADIAAASRIIAEHGIELVVGQCRTQDEAITLAQDASAVIFQHMTVDARMLEAWPRCRIVAHFGKGVDNIDVAAASERGIWVSNVRDANWDEVSNHVLALLLGWARGLLTYDRHVRSGGWSYRAAAPRSRLAGQVLGLIGYGDIARVLARKAKGLGLEVLAHARRVEPDGVVDFVSLPDLLSRADYVSLHIPLTPETRHLIGRKEFAMMKPSAFLINAARGGVIDQEALIDALRSGRIAGAGLDVMDPEPPKPDDPLLAMDNVILTPHVAWYSEESREHVTTTAAREAVRVLCGGAPLSAVNPGAAANALARADAIARMPPLTGCAS